MYLDCWKEAWDNRLYFYYEVSKVLFQLLIPLYGGKSMSSETTMVAEQYRLQEWAAQIRECQNRPAGMSVIDWCACHGITKTNYYYRLRRVRKACLEDLQEKHPQQSIIPVKAELIQQLNSKNSLEQAGIDISMKGYSVHVAESTPMPLLAEVLRVIRDA